MKTACLFYLLLSLRCVCGETLLFVDDHEILYRSGTRRQMHVPKRHAGNPLVVGPTVKNQAGYNSVHRDPETGRFQMWYQLSGKDTAVCYAESADGIVWNKPELDVVAHPGITDRNVVLDSVEQYGASVVVDAPGGDPERRYKMAYWSIPHAVPEAEAGKDPRGKNGGMFVAFSADGIHWNKQPGPVLRGAYGRMSEPPKVGEEHDFGVHSSVSDVLDAMYDPLRKKYVVYAKAWIDAPDGMTYWKRAIVRTESDDFLKWSLPQLVMAPDEFDGVRPADYPGTRRGVQLHGAPAFLHHGVYFALVQVADFETHGLQPIELATSRDGIAWQRPFRSTPFMGTVENGNGFDASRIFSNATPVVLDDEMRFYYAGAENPWQFGRRENEWGSKKRMPKTGIGLAMLPLDRFAGVKPLEKLGQMTLKPRPLGGIKGLTLNADAGGGAVRVELLDERGYRLAGFSKADAVPITGDGLRHEVKWKRADLSKLPVPEMKVIIRIHLDNAEAFALTLRDL
ncbi:hypothetical protein [Prosthecobacter sp.]|uniref:hypothetical protein n=1 Tax=Prosthecobacter sp. TaxID=1965333 RepID=UPI0037849834